MQEIKDRAASLAGLALERLVGDLPERVLGEVQLDRLKNVSAEFTEQELRSWSTTSDTPVGRLEHLAPVVQMSETPAHWAVPTVPLGYHQPVWPAQTS